MSCHVPVRMPDGTWLHATVDEADFHRLRQYPWKGIFTPSGGVYAQTTYVAENGDRFPMFMHQLVLDADAGLHVDHIDGLTLNNERGNLRVATQSQNQANSPKHRQNTSGYKGVTKHKRSGKWQAQIQKDGRMRHLGLYADPVDAARAYDRAALELYGAFARPNFVKSDSGATRLQTPPPERTTHDHH
jgi:hypothetical protein